MPHDENKIVIDAADANDAYGAIVSDLVSLIAHVQASLSRIESVIACETSALGAEVPDTDIVVLDDVTPRYARAGALLKACDAGLSAALELMLDSQVQRRLN